jgi:GAF domain-containing protein
MLGLLATNRYTTFYVNTGKHLVKFSVLKAPMTSRSINNTIGIADNIRKARLYRNYSQDYLAQKLNISQNGYSKIELGYTSLSVERLIVIAEVLEVDLLTLINGSDIRMHVAAIGRINIVPQLLDVICNVTGMGFAAVARVTDEKWVACQVKDTISFGLKPGNELKLETTICNEIRQHGQAVIIDHVACDPTFSGHHTSAQYGFQSYISVPITRADGTFFGTLCAIDPAPAKLNNPEVIGMFNLFAELIALHLDAVEREAFAMQPLATDSRIASLTDRLIMAFGGELPQAITAILNQPTPFSILN